MIKLVTALCLTVLCAGLISCYSSPDYALHFPNKRVMDYANIWGMLWLRKFTVCFWMKSSCNNYGTPFSYAVPGQANELLVYNYKDFHLYIGGTARRSGVSANDGRWHHICVTWRNSDGAWKFYKDGVLHHHSINFKRRYIIKARGSLVLGQEQDGVATRFEPTQSFVGTLTNVNLWNYVLSGSTIKAYSRSCRSGRGNVYKWADFRYGIKGKTAVVIPSPCYPLSYYG